ncbi:MAG: DNA-methyltransferase [Microbacterium sp.]
MARAWPTPAVADTEGGRTSRSGDRKDELLLNTMARAWDDYPTPSATEYGSSQNGINGKGGEFERPSAGTPSLSTAARSGALPGGKGVLNPVFVELLMGWPEGWTSTQRPAGAWHGFPPAPRDTEGWATYLERVPGARPAVGRDEVEDRIDRLRACGNGVVPQQAAAAFDELFAALGVRAEPEVEMDDDGRDGAYTQAMTDEFAEAQFTKRGDALLYREDAVSLLSTLPEESVNLIITDPAYESLEKHRAVGTTTRLTNDWFEIFKNERFPEFFVAAYRALAKNSHLYVLCDQETMFAIKPMGEAAGFRFWKPIVWDKQKIGMGYHYRARYEVILFFEKGKRRLNDLGVPDVLAFPRVTGGYPTEKPVDLLKVLVRQSSAPGEVVCDPFMGSGSTGDAALYLGRHFIGGDTSARAVELARARLK